jgi:hypothetical protein
MAAGEHYPSHFISWFPLFSAEFSEGAAKAWRRSNFQLDQISAGIASVFDAASTFECPDDSASICPTAKNIILVALIILRDGTRGVSRAQSLIVAAIFKYMHV